MVDVSKIKVGDTVLAKGVVRSIYDPKLGYLIGFGDSIGETLKRAWISTDFITSHTPAPRKFTVGDRVYGKCSQHHGRIVALDGAQAWVKFAGCAENENAFLHNLVHAESPT